MAGERRTKAQKIHAKVAHSSLSYSFSNGAISASNAPESVMTVSKKSAQPEKYASSMNDLFEYDVTYIYRDLAKTVAITGIMFAALIGLTFII